MLAARGLRRRRPTTENPPTTPPPAAGYTGPPPATPDVQAFKLNLWDNLQATNRCGAVPRHGRPGAELRAQRRHQPRLRAANTVVDLSNPSDSRMVTEGRRRPQLLARERTAACADMLTVLDPQLGRPDAGRHARRAARSRRRSRTSGASKTFPASPALFGSTVYPVLTQYCSRCHSSGATTPQSPFFAEADVDVAYAAVRAKINLDSPDAVAPRRAPARRVPQLLERLRDEPRTSCRPRSRPSPTACRSRRSIRTWSLEGADAVRRHGRERRQPLRQQRRSRCRSSRRARGTIAYDTSGVEPRAEPDAVGRRDLGRRLGHRRARRQGAGLDDRRARSSTTSSRRRASTRSRPGSRRPTSRRRTRAS